MALQNSRLHQITTSRVHCRIYVPACGVRPRQRCGGDLRDVQQLRRRAPDAPLPPNASRNIVWQKGHAVPITCAPVATSSSTRSTFTRLPFSSPRNIWPPPAPQQNERSRARCGSITSRGARRRLRAALHKYCDSGPGSRDRGRPSSRGRHRATAVAPARAPATRCDARSRTSPPYSRQSVPMVRTQCGQIETILPTLAARSVSIFASATCETARSLPRRRAGSPVHFSLRSTPNVTPAWRSTRASASTISRPCGSYAPMQPSHRQYSCVPS